METNWQHTFPHLREINDTVINDVMNNAGTINMPAKVDFRRDRGSTPIAIKPMKTNNQISGADFMISKL